MSILAEKFRTEVSKLKDVKMKSESEFDVAYSTGFLNFDFKMGVKIFVDDRKNDRQFQYYSAGICNGSMCMIIGRSGSGKTTLVTQMAANIIRPFRTSCILEDNIEAGSTFVRKELLTGFHGDELDKRVISRNAGVTAENMYTRIKMIHDIKMENPEEYTYDTELYDTRGNRIYKLEPTVYILDSLALLMPEKYTTEDELSGQMSATAAAKANASIFKRLIPICKAANIILMIINHINQKVELNVFQATKSQVSYLKQSESIPGGNAPIYLSNTLIRVDDKSKLKASEGFGIDGSLVELTLVKSRANKANQSATLVFDQQNGFDSELSLFVMLKEAGKIKGAGNYYYIDGYDHIKFSQKTFKQKLFENKELQDAFSKTVVEHLTAELDAQYDNMKDNNERADLGLNATMMNMMNASLYTA